MALAENFVSDWYETTGVFTLRVVASFASEGNATIWVMDGQDTGDSSPTLIRTQSLATTDGGIAGDIEITGRYFMFELGSGAEPDETVTITLRAV